MMIEVDNRNRVTLPGKAHERYLVREEADGTLVLEPAVVMTKLEAAFLADPELQARFAHARAHPEESRPHVPRTKRRTKG